MERDARTLSAADQVPHLIVLIRRRRVLIRCAFPHVVPLEMGQLDGGVVRRRRSASSGGQALFASQFSSSSLPARPLSPPHRGPDEKPSPRTRSFVSSAQSAVAIVRFSRPAQTSEALERSTRRSSSPIHQDSQCRRLIKNRIHGDDSKVVGISIRNSTERGRRF